MTGNLVTVPGSNMYTYLPQPTELSDSSPSCFTAASYTIKLSNNSQGFHLHLT